MSRHSGRAPRAKIGIVPISTLLSTSELMSITAAPSWRSAEFPALSTTYTVEAGHSVRIEDIIEPLGYPAGASLRLTPSAGTVMASARTYAVAAEGTYGQYIPLLDETHAITEVNGGRLIMLRQSVDLDSGYRTNLRLVNITTKPCDVSIEIHDAAGALLGTVDRSLGALESIQLSEVLRRFVPFDESAAGGGIDDAYALVSTTTAGGRMLAYASLIDNRTNDSVLMVAARD